MSDNRLVFSFMQPIYRIGICAHWPLIRFIVGMNLIPHGYRKLFGGSVEKTAAAFGKIDFPFPFDLFSSLSLTYVVAMTEFFGGILIIVGFLTRLAAAAATISWLLLIMYIFIKDFSGLTMGMNIHSFGEWFAWLYFFVGAVHSL